MPIKPFVTLSSATLYKGEDIDGDSLDLDLEVDAKEVVKKYFEREGRAVSSSNILKAVNDYNQDLSDDPSDPKATSKDEYNNVLVQQVKKFLTKK